MDLAAFTHLWELGPDRDTLLYQSLPYGLETSYLTKFEAHLSGRAGS